MQDTLVDIVLVTNRSSPYLREALESVSSQTYKSWRLTIVDDGSPEPRYLRSIAADLPNCSVLTQAPSGLPAGRNAGVAVGSSPLIAFLDDDDRWAPDKLELQVDSLERAPDSVGCYTAGWYMDSNGEPFPFDEGWSADPARSEDFLSGRVPLPRIVTLMVHREAFRAVGAFDPTYSLAEDLHFIYRLAMHGEMAAVTERLVGYRRHDLNMSSAGGLADRLAVRRALRELAAGAEKRGDLERQYALLLNLESQRRAWARDSVRNGMKAVRAGDIGELARELAWAATGAPLHTLRAMGEMSVKKFGARRAERKPN